MRLILTLRLCAGFAILLENADGVGDGGGLDKLMEEKDVDGCRRRCIRLSPILLVGV